jgi:RNA polymerase-binding transcription factor DksA
MAKTKKQGKAAKKSPAKAKKAAPAKAKKDVKKAAKKAVAKKVVKKVVAKKSAKKVVAKKITKPVAKKAAKPVAKKTAPKAPAKPVAKKKEVKAPVKPVVAPVPTPKKTVASVKTTERAPVPSVAFFPPLTQRPIAHKPANKPAVSDDKTRYSDTELKEFEALIYEKLEKARNEYKILKETLNRNNDEGTDATSGGNTKVLEDGAETAEKENLSQLAARQQKYITNLENALVRIKNGTYGICSVTGKLIPKDRLIAVPHTTQSIEAKMMKKD